MKKQTQLSPFEKIDTKIAKKLMDVLNLMDKREMMHRIRYENISAQALLWKHRAAAHKAHHTMKKRRLQEEARA